MPSVYEIRVEGFLDQEWSEWLDGMEITWQENGETIISGILADQAALYGLLNRIRDLNLKLILVEMKDPH